MKEAVIVGINFSESDDLPEGFFALMGVDKIATEEHGYFHLIEFALPEETRPWVEMWLEQVEEAHIVYGFCAAEEFSRHGIRYQWTRAEVEALTWLID